MHKASEVAVELRKIADALDSNPELEMDEPSIYLYYYSESDKQKFIELIKILPRPLQKEYEDGTHGNLNVKYRPGPISMKVSIPRSAVCEIIEPARGPVFKCSPLLTEAEDAELITE